MSRDKNKLRIDFDVEGFENLVYQNGAKMKLERAILCPCGRKDNSHPKNCVNCNGSGFFFVEHTDNVWGMVSSLTHNQILGMTAQEINNTANLTLSNTYDSRLQVYDKLTVLDGLGIIGYEQIFPEIRTNNDNNEVLDVQLHRLIQSIESVYLYVDADTPLTLLTENTDYTFDQNIITLSDVLKFELQNLSQEYYSISVRYRYLPEYMVMRSEHNIRQTRIFEGTNEQFKFLPLMYIIQEAWYFIQNGGFTDAR